MSFACNLCHGLMTAAQSLVATPCGHLYHNICVNTFIDEKDLEDRPICPCCQYELNVETGLITLHPIPFKQNSSPVEQQQESNQESRQESHQEKMTLRSAGGSGDVVTTFIQDRLDRILSQTQAGSQPLPQSKPYSIDVQRSLFVADEVLDAPGRGRENSPRSPVQMPTVCGDAVFMIDGDVITLDQITPSTSDKLEERSIIFKRKVPPTNEGKERTTTFAKQNVVLPERSMEPVPRRAHEQKQEPPKSHSQMGAYSQGGDEGKQGLCLRRSPVRFLPPAPSSSSSMWGTPSWQMGAPSRASVSGSSGNNLHRMDNVQYYPSPFIREPVKQQPPFPIQLPFHRPTGQFGSTPNNVNVNAVPTVPAFEQRYEGSNLSKRKASPLEEQEQGHGCPRSNIETIVIHDDDRPQQHNERPASVHAQVQAAGVAAASCNCCFHPNMPATQNLSGEHQLWGAGAAEEEDRPDNRRQDWVHDMSQQQQ